MIKSLFVDDVKLPQDFGCESVDGVIDTKVVKTYAAAILELETEQWDILWLDWDFQDPQGDGLDILDWLSDNVGRIPEKINIITSDVRVAGMMRPMAGALMAMRRRALASEPV
jgi:CheY-like chemotaxis protein